MASDSEVGNRLTFEVGTDDKAAQSDSEVGNELTFEIDADDRIVKASPSWDRFAASNDAPELTARSIRGRSLFDFIADDETRELQRLILEQARRSSGPVEYTIRCDSPTHLRLLQLVVSSPDGKRVRTTTRTLEFTPQESGLLLVKTVDRSGESLKICSWCRKVWLSGRWLNPAEAARAVGLFESGAVPPLTHGICEDCFNQTSEAALGTGDT